MKKIFEAPEVRVIALEPKDVIVTSGVTRGEDVTPGQNVPCDAPGRETIWD